MSKRSSKNEKYLSFVGVVVLAGLERTYINQHILAVEAENTAVLVCRIAKT